MLCNLPLEGTAMAKKPLTQKHALSIERILAEEGIASSVIEFNTSTRTATDAATTIGCRVGQIVKSLIFKTAITARPILVLTSGPNRVNEKKFAELIGETVIKADATFTQNITGFAIGGIPPIGHTKRIDLIFIDQDILNFDLVWAAAGTPHTVFSIKSSDLLSITKGRVISVI